MGKKKLDKETEKIFTTGELLKSLIENRGWGVAREKLLLKVAKLLNLKDIGTDAAKAEDIVLQIGIRQGVAESLIEWLHEIEGDVEQHKANTDAFTEVTDKYILHMEQEPKVIE